MLASIARLDTVIAMRELTDFRVMEIRKKLEPALAGELERHVIDSK
jgi:hypothetical protein